MKKRMGCVEKKRLQDDDKKKKYWKKWGPYLTMRQWGTVREDLSQDGSVWESFSFDDAYHRTYKWGEDGIAGLSDSHQRLCFSFAFWNEKDPILKERIFGLSNAQGNHGEDVKDLYYYLDNTPTHSYMQALYKYPQSAFPYDELKDVNKNRSQQEREHEILDTGLFDENRYFDCFIEYAKESPNDIWIRLRAINRGSEAAPLQVVAKLWARNVWRDGGDYPMPLIRYKDKSRIHCELDDKEVYSLYADKFDEVIFAENESNFSKIDGSPNHAAYTKDGLSEYIVHGKKEAVNPACHGTLSAFVFKKTIDAGKEETIILRLKEGSDPKVSFDDSDHIFKKRAKECDEFYASFTPKELTDDQRNIQRQSFAGMLWNKQYYRYSVEDWLKQINREHPRNINWFHLYSEDIISTPDDWEYPAFFSWDSAFHMILYGYLDPHFAKKQLSLFTREWYMHPNGQLPAYEWDFDDVNPPVHAWSAWRVYKIDEKMNGKGDRLFLKSIFQKLLMNFTWWVNREDESGRNIFKGGFLGLDNISVFNRSADLPAGGELYQSDATSWMGMYCLNMLTIAFELAKEDKSYSDMASKFYEHFIHISQAVNFPDNGSIDLWDEKEGFYYDKLLLPNGEQHALKVRSLVGLMPMLAVTTIDEQVLSDLPGFAKRMNWFIDHKQDLCDRMACMKRPGVKRRRLLSILTPKRLQRILQLMLDEDRFLSPYGIRSISRCHGEHPFELKVDGKDYRVDYEPAESSNRLFGGNSNWRGPIWMPINFLIIESLQKYHHYYGDDFKVEFPTHSGKMITLWEVSLELSKRLVALFEKDENGRRPFYAEREKFQSDPHFNDYLFYNEYFHGETGEGLGASHQNGWTGLVAKLIQQLGNYGHS